MATEKILVVDDETSMTQYLSIALRKAGYDVTAVNSGQEALDKAKTETYAVAITDFKMPGMDGIEVLAGLKKIDPSLPVILMTARDAVADRVAGLDAGADDYLVKPFATEELLARIRARLRARPPEGGPTVGDCRIDLDRQQLERDGETIALSAQEVEILRLLLAAEGRVVTREVLLREVWGWRASATRSVDHAVARLRGKLERDTRKPRHLLTVRGVGYRLVS